MDYSNFKWNMDTESTSDENGIHIYAPEKTNYFVNPIDGSVETYAPFFYQEVDGDFVLRSKVWLQLARKDNVFAVHYSLDGENYKMARICSLPMQKKIQVGLAAQSPVGKGGVRHFEDVVLEQRTLCDIRGGK